MLPPSAAICLLGFGEAGRLLGTELAARGCAVRCYDRLLDHAETRASLQQRIEDAGVHPASLAEALRGAKLVLCIVPAHEMGDLVRDTVALLQRGQIFLDLTDVPTAAKSANAARVEAGGADYVDGALHTSVMTQRLAAPMQLGGPRAAALAPALNALGFHARAVSGQAGFDRELDVPVSPSPAEAPARQQGRRGELP